jgi:hypothetical protein
MIKSFVFMVMILFALSCDDSNNFKTDKCANVTCSNKGSCYVDHKYYIRCKCDEGYYEQGQNCIKYSCKEGYKLDGTNCIKICQDCEGVEVYTSNPCENKDCSGNGFCSSEPDRAIYCNCYPGYKVETGLICVESKCDSVSCAS